jgi:hypothetical protein
MRMWVCHLAWPEMVDKSDPGSITSIGFSAGNARKRTALQETSVGLAVGR